MQAVPRKYREDPPRREDRSDYLAQHRHRPDQPGRVERGVHRLPFPPPLQREGCPFSRVLREVSPGARPPAEGDLRRVQARHCLLREPGTDEPRGAT
jgi:hypothetical protein